MPGDKADVVMFGPKPIIEEALTKAGFEVHKAWAAPDRDAFVASIAPRVRAIAAVAGHGSVDSAIMSRFPKLEIVSSFGVGYDHIDAKWAGQNGVIVTNTPDVLNEEVADTALGLTLCTVRHLPQAEKYLRAGNWPKHGDYQLTPSLRDRTVGIVGMGRIGKAIARRFDAMKVPVVYHSRRPADVSYKHYPNILDMARDVNLMIVITPGGAATKNLVNADVLKALGPEGILINVARGSVVDEAGADQGAEGQDDPLRRPRRVRAGAAGAAGTDRHGERRAAAACRLGLACDAPRDGRTGGEQHHLVVRRQGCADAGRRDAGKEAVMMRQVAA